MFVFFFSNKMSYISVFLVCLSYLLYLSVCLYVKDILHRVLLLPRNGKRMKQYQMFYRHSYLEELFG